MPVLHGVLIRIAHTTHMGNFPLGRTRAANNPARGSAMACCFDKEPRFSLGILLAALTGCTPAMASPPGSITATVYVGRHFEVRDHDQPTKYVFNGATRVAEITGSLSPNQRVQRLRLYPGWNLCSLAVSGPFPASGTEAISAAYQWNLGVGGYSKVSPGQTLPAGTVLWLKAKTNAIVTVFGTYTDPVPQQLPAGGAYVAGTGLEAWSLTLPDSASSWDFDAATAQWCADLGSLAGVSCPLPPLSPGQAFYLRTPAPLFPEIPAPALRIRYYHQDHLGSSSAVTDVQSSLVEEAAYYPFGTSRNEYQPRHIEEPYQFTEKERDRESRFHYFEARLLAGNLGRFITVDPLAGVMKQAWLSSPQRLNFYAYAQNQPLLYVDPTGQDRFAEQDPELQKVMTESFESGSLPRGDAKTAEGFVDRLSNREFAALTSVYSGMKERGLWKYVKQVTGFSTAGELSISFSISDESAFKDALFGLSRNGDPFDYSYGARGFSQDPSFYNKFHKGSESLREISETDSLHISVYTKNHVTAHIDRDSPVALDTGPITSMDLARGLRHQGREAGGPLVGATVLGWLHIPESISLSPGLQFLPEQPVGRGEPPGIYYVGFRRDF